MGEDQKGGDMRTCKCEHWAVCPICQPDWFDKEGNRLPPEPTPLQKANGRIEELEQQLATFHSAVEHVTEDGCTRRSVVAMPEGWAMVHKDRLYNLELAEEKLADVRNQVLDECAAIAEDTAAGRDAEAIADAIRAMKVRKCAECVAAEKEAGK